MQRWLEEEQKGPNLQGLGMSNSYHGEPYIPADIFNELQSEVSSLLEFKNALLNEFPHLHQKISNLGVGQPAPQDERRRSTIGLATKSREEQDRDLSDDIPSSWNVSNPNTGSMPRLRKLRKSPEGSSTGSTVADSGFSTEKDGNSGTSTLLSPANGGKGQLYTSSYASPPEVRWDTWMMSSSHPGPPGSPPPEDDELMSLLDVIHRKAVKLRAKEMVEAEMEENRSRPQPNLPREDSRKFSGDKLLPGLHPISENEGGTGDNEMRVTEEAKDRVRRKIIPDDGINRQDRELLVDRISELESETLQSHRKVSKLEAEIARVNQQKEVLEDQLKTAVNIKSELDSKIHDMHSQYVKGGGSKKEGGIIHSVQILTGGQQQVAQGPTERLVDRRLLSQSETNLRRLGEGHGSINIEIRQPGGLEQSRSSEHLLYRQDRQPGSRKMSPMGHSRSVVNLQQAEDPTRSNSKFFQRISAPPPPGTKVSPQLHRVLSNEKLSPKSRSVENLSERARRDLNETSLQPRHQHHQLDSPSSRLKGAQSEQVLSRLGRDGRARLDPALSSSVLSMPAELARGLRVRPNRERIRQVLATNSVLELQRQLLTTVMENEVYKTQMGRMTEGWNGRIDEFERVNLSLQSSLARLREDNEQLRLQVQEKSIELEGTRARVRQLEMRPEGSRKGSTSSTASTIASSSKLIQTDVNNELASRLGTDNYVKFGPIENPRVTFDLGPKKAKLLETASVKRPVTVDLKSRQPSQLPSNAKQQLQEMAGIKRNYRKNSDTPQARPNRLNLAQAAGSPPPPPPARHTSASPPASPAKPQSPSLPSPPTSRPSRTSLTRRDSRASQHNSTNSAKNSMMNLQNNNIVNQRPTKRESLPRVPGHIGGGAGGQPRTRTPSIERSISSLKDGLADAREVGKESGKGRLLPAPPTASGLQMEHGLTSLELKHMGRDTIAGLIAGILQKYTKKEDADEGDARPEGVSQVNASFVEIALADEEDAGRGGGGSQPGSRPVTVLRRASQCSPAGQLQPEQTRTSQRTPTGKSWEAYKHTEEEVHKSHTAYTLEAQSVLQKPDQPAQYESLTLPDSLNEFEGEEYQSPQLYPDSLGHGGARVARLDCPQDADSLQFNVSPTPATNSKSPLDSLIAIKSEAMSKITAAEFFDSITSIEKPKDETGGPIKRRIIPYCDNSLSSGTSAFTSQDVSFDSKDSSPSDNDRTRQGLPPPQASASVYSPSAVTLAIHPLESPRSTGPVPAPIHPLSRRYQPPTPNSPSVMPPLRIEDYMATVDEPQPEELERTAQGNANEVRRASERERTSEVLANQTKENAHPHPAQHQAQSRPRDTNMSMAKAATEKLKWKFLGW